MPDFPLAPEAQLRERIRDLEAEVERLRRGGAAPQASQLRDEQLIESEERFRVAFSTTPAALSIARPSDGRILHVNQAFCRNAGRREEEIVGRTFEELGIYADQAERERILGMLISQGFVDTEEFRYRSSDGSERVGLLSSRPVSLRGEMCQLGMLIDITSLKRAEAERNRLEAELRQAQKMEAMGRLAGGVAHDFNNILTAITANVELGLLSLAPGAPGRELLEEIGRNAWRAAKLTRQMLAFSRRQVIEPRPLDLSLHVGELRSMLQRLLGEDVTLVFELPPGLAPVMADAGQVEQVVVNLVVNARDALAAHGTITVTARAATAAELAAHPDRAGAFVVLAVSDDGAGIPADVLPHVFEPFFSTKADRGTGLGLSTVEGIATQHGGFVEVETTPGKGTAFRVFLPVASGAPAAAAAAPRPPAARRSGAVLLAEDDDAVREPIAHLLERLGFTVVRARNGVEALGLLRAAPASFDVLVTDVVMPSMSGRALVNASRELVPRLPVVYLSGHTQDVLDRKGVLDPGVVLLRKPFDAEALGAAIDRAREAAGAAGAGPASAPVNGAGARPR